MLGVVLAAPPQRKLAEARALHASRASPPSSAAWAARFRPKVAARTTLKHLSLVQPPGPLTPPLIALRCSSLTALSGPAPHLKVLRRRRGNAGPLNAT